MITDQDIHVLLIEDDLSSQEIMREALEANYMNVTVVTDAYKALEILNDSTQVKPDILIVDLALPEVNGIALMKIIRGNPITHDIPAVAVTAFAKEYTAEAIEDLVDHYFEKPLSILDFSEHIRRLVPLATLRTRSSLCDLCGRTNNPLLDILTSGEARSLLPYLSDSVIRRTITEGRIDALSSGRAWLLRYVQVLARWGNQPLPPYRYWEGTAVNIPCPVCTRTGDPLQQVISVTDPAVDQRFTRKLRSQIKQRKIPGRKSAGTWLLLRSNLEDIHIEE